MKKILSIALALVMCFAMFTVAFAAETKTTISGDGNAASQSEIIKVSTAFEDGKTAQDYEWFEVVIPADVSIEWGDTAAYDMNYDVACQLATGRTIKVATEFTNVLNGEGSHVLKTADGTKELAYAVTGFDAADYSYGPVIGAKAADNTVSGHETHAATVQVADWSGVAIDTYVDYVTYTVSVEGTIGA